MFNKIINNTLIISAFAFNSGIFYKCFKDFYDENRMKNNVFISQSNSIFNSGMFLGTLIGVGYIFLDNPFSLHQTLKLEN